MAHLLQIKDLSINFVAGNGEVPAVKQLSLQVDRGETLALVGESGSGKSVTALSILRLLPTPPGRFSSGEILFAPEGNEPIDLLKQSRKQMQSIRGNRIAMIFQEPMTSLNPVLSCGLQVAEAIRLHRDQSYKQAREETIDLFNKVKLPDPSAIFSRYPHQLSGGQKQRVMIAMAISCKPDLLICDEPTTALDVTVQQTILQLIRELQETENMGIIFITHDLGVVAEIADRAIVMYKGNMLEEGRVREMFQNPQQPYTRGLLQCRPILHQKGERLPVVADFLERKIETPEKIWQPATPPKEKLPDYSGQALLSVQHLRVWFPSRRMFPGKKAQSVRAVDEVSFDVYKGETLGIVGESGSGKTTLGRSILRLIKPTGGKILFNGRDLASCDASELKRLRKDIQIVFQDPYSSLNPRLKIGTALEEPIKVHRLLRTEIEREHRVSDLLEKVNLQPGHVYRYPHEFSGGQRQRIVIARALALNPSFVVFDESVSALDVSVQAQVLNLINDLKKALDLTVIFISHDLGVVKYISDRILVMNKGKIEEIGPAEAIYRNPGSAYTRKLIDSIPKGFS